MRVEFTKDGTNAILTTHNTPVPRIGEMITFYGNHYRVHDVQWVVFDQNRIDAKVTVGRISP